MDLEGLVFWSFGALEVSKGAFDARARDLNFLNFERLIWKVWRSLNSKLST